ncbi:VCBS repeat-containing protein [Streptomyces sp. NBC_01285]|uniref:FG-GAP repeat domain-containing protein n=1 Tax=unclassified Streptomyces TaxID=2593676 RepID=UPI002254A649|nr:VCBS repeat-containing protein [Streptomyces sp. NBC_01285]MCX4772071.1 VCBS repeat-containing protein [Streptomyces sp. NBC_01285]
MEPGRSLPARTKRGRRIAACTALVLSAGMLLAVPASADGPAAAPRGAAPRPAPDPAPQPTLVLPERTAQKPRAAGAEGASAVTVKPRFDVNRDGQSDFAYRTLDGELNVIQNRWQGGFPYLLERDEPNELAKDIVTPGDLDGNGMPEILTLSATGKLSLHQAVTNGVAGRATWSGTGWQKYNKVVAAGDLSGDGRGDVLARTPSGDLYAYRSTGSVDSEPFEAGVKVDSGWDSYDQIVGANDVNRDGIGDVFARTPAGDLYLYSGTGDITKPFKPRVKTGYGFNIYNQLVAMDDINGDGLGDIAARKPNGDVILYLASGYGTLDRTPVSGGTGWNTAGLFVGAGGNPDFGKHEVQAITNSGYSWWYKSRNNGQFFARSTGNLNGLPSGGMNLGTRGLASSLDNDGEPDPLWVHQGQLFTGGHFIGLGWDVYNSLTGPGDLSGDGKGDLLARDAKGNVYLYEGNGLGSKFAPKLKVGYGWDIYNKIVGAGDLSGDGLADVVARDTKGDLYLYQGTGKASAPFKARVKIGYGYNTYKLFAAPGDVNGDGKADLIGVDGKGDLYRYTSTGTGTIATRVKIGYGWDIYNNVS